MEAVQEQKRRLWRSCRDQAALAGGGIVLAGVGGAIVAGGLKLTGQVHLPDLTFLNTLGLHTSMMGGTYIVCGTAAVFFGATRATRKAVKALTLTA